MTFISKFYYSSKKYSTIIHALYELQLKEVTRAGIQLLSVSISLRLPDVCRRPLFFARVLSRQSTYLRDAPTSRVCHCLGPGLAREIHSVISPPILQGVKKSEILPVFLIAVNTDWEISPTPPIILKMVS